MLQIAVAVWSFKKQFALTYRRQVDAVDILARPLSLFEEGGMLLWEIEGICIIHDQCVSIF